MKITQPAMVIISYKGEEKGLENRLIVPTARLLHSYESPCLAKRDRQTEKKRETETQRDSERVYMTARSVAPTQFLLGSLATQRVVVRQEEGR